MFSLVIMSFAEDLKVDKYFKRYLKITLVIGFAGILMDIFKWNYLCPFNCSLLTFSPFLTLLITKGIIEFYKRVLKKEGFQMYNGKLSDGIWTRNKGNLNNKGYYSWYTTNIMSFPIFILAILFLIIDKHIC